MAWGVIHPVHVAARARGDREAGDRGPSVSGHERAGRGAPAAGGERHSQGGDRPAEGAAAAAEAEAVRDGEGERAAGSAVGQAEAQASTWCQARSPGRRRRARAGGRGAGRVAFQGLRGHHRPGSAAGAAGDPLSPGALADGGRADDHGPAAGRDRRRVRPGAAPVRPGRPCPGPGDQRAADRPAQRHRHGHLEAAGGAAADRSARRFRGRGPGGLACGSRERGLDHRRRHRRPPRRAQRRDHPDRRRPVHRLPHQPVEVAHQLPRLPARRPRPTTWSTRRRWPTCAGTIWPAR